MIVRGLEREEDLRRRFPFGKADGSSPYVVSHRHGAWLEARSGTSDVARTIDEETERLRAEAARGIVPPGERIHRLPARAGRLRGAEAPCRAVTYASEDVEPVLDRTAHPAEFGLDHPVGRG